MKTPSTIAVLANKRIFQTVQRAFENFQVDILVNYDDAISYLKDTVPEVLIVEEQDGIELFFQDICKELPYPKHPLLCCYVNGSYENVTVADLCVTDDTMKLLIPPMLQSRRRAVALHCEYEQLQDQLKSAPSRDEVALLKSTIVRNVSHELRTPVLQVKAAVALILEDIQDEKLNEYATGAVARLEDIVNNITMLSGSQDHAPSALLVQDTYVYARRNLLRVWKHRGQGDRIVEHIDPKLPPVNADKKGLSAIFHLLLDNALKFSDDDVHVYITLAESKDHINISIEDRGIGIDPIYLDSIFDSFYQIDGSNTRRFSGIGVGLAIVKYILDNHETTIEVDSELGKGSKFSFSLPVMDLKNS